MKKYFLMLGLGVALAGCATSPEPDYYALSVQPGAAAPQIAAVIKVQTPVIAGYLDRPDFVSQEGDYALSIDESDNWAEPLDSMFARILAGDLQQRLPNATILTADNGTPANTRFTIDVTLQRFNPVGGGQALLEGELIVTDKTSHALPQAMPLHMLVETGGSAPGDVAASLSELIARLSDQIAHDLGVIGAPAPDAA